MSSSSAELTDTAYDILKVLGKDADFCMTQLKPTSKMHSEPIIAVGRNMADNQK